MRRLIALLTETKTVRYFHTSEHVYAPGYVINAKMNDDLHKSSQFTEREHWLEMYRPRDHLPRNKSVYMTAGKPDYLWGNYGYEVEPLGSVERNDINWFEALVYIDDEADLEDDELEEAQQWAHACVAGYWSGKPCNLNKQKPRWEYRTQSVRIIRAFGKQQRIS